MLLTANEVWGKVIFSVACVKDSVHRGIGEYLGRYAPLGRYTPQACTTHWAGTPPGQVHLPGQVPPGQVYSPQDRYPPEQCMLGNTGNKWAVRILLECILVSTDGIVCVVRNFAFAFLRPQSFSVNDPTGSRDGCFSVLMSELQVLLILRKD